MNRMWEIREGDSNHRDSDYSPKSYKRSASYRGGMSSRESSSEYEEGFEEGFKCAIKQLKKLHEEMFSE